MDFAFVEHDDAVGDFEGAVHVVGDDDAGDFQLALQLENQLVDDVGAHGIKAGGGLVVEDDAGVEGDGAGEGDAFFLSAVERFGLRHSFVGIVLQTVR